MRHIACQNEDCVNNGAPYHLPELDEPDEGAQPDDEIVLCPVCSNAMATIPTPDLSPPTAADSTEGDD